MAPPRGPLESGRSRLLVATRSTHKLRELRELLGPLRAQLVDLDDVGVRDEAIEDGDTFEANASKKARFYAALSGLPTLAEIRAWRSTLWTADRACAPGATRASWRRTRRTT